MICAGVACFVCPFIPNETAVTGLAVAGKFFVSIAFAVIYIFTAELFPTSIRTIGLGLASLCARIGGILFPIIIDFFQAHKHPEAPLLIFGVSILVSGGLLFLLPETLNKILPETLEQANEFGRPRFCGGRGINAGFSDGGGGGGVAGSLLRPEGQALLGNIDEDEEDEELYSPNTLT